MTVSTKSNKVAFILKKQISDTVNKSSSLRQIPESLLFSNLTDEQFIKAVLFKYYSADKPEHDIWMQAIAQRITWLSESLQNAVLENEKLVKMLG